MINQLLGEPYWEELESHISKFMNSVDSDYFSYWKIDYELVSAEEIRMSFALSIFRKMLDKKTKGYVPKNLNQELDAEYSGRDRIYMSRVSLTNELMNHLPLIKLLLLKVSYPDSIIDNDKLEFWGGGRISEVEEFIRFLELNQPINDLNVLFLKTPNFESK